LLTGSDGVQVVTEQDAVLPAAAFPTDGQVTVLAHAVSIGPAGNISPHDIYGACCRENVFAVNPLAFTGGQLARTFRMVTAQNITGTVALLKASLAHSVQAAFAAQVEHLATLIAGETVAEATSPLLQETGVQTVSFAVTGHDSTTLPTNPQDIHMLVLYTQ
jgi:hypothetical protein